MKFFSKTQKNLLLFSFGIFGFSALVYQVVFAKKLVLLFGLTAPAIATVLAVYFSGLALGSLFLGKLADRLPPKKTHLLFVWLFALVGIYGLLFPTLFKLLNFLILSVNGIYPLNFSGFNFFAFAFSFLFLVFPAILIGAGFPIINKLLTREEGGIGHEVSIVYFVETLGSVFGATLAGFWLIPSFGNNTTIFLAAGLNIIAAGFLFWFLKNLGPKTYNLSPGKNNEELQSVATNLQRPLFLYTLFVTGFLALALEVVYTKTLILFIGSSTYAFSLILITFLLGIALGSWAASFFIDRIKQEYAYFGMMLGLVGFWLFLTTKSFDRLPFWYLNIFKSFESLEFQAVLASQSLLTFLVIFPAAFLMGALFVMAVKFARPAIEKLGRGVGKLYFANTLGGVLGSLTAGFLFLPLLGYQKTLTLILLAYFCAALFFIFKDKALSRAIKTIFAAFLVLFGAFAAYSQFFSPWSREHLFMGSFPYADTYINFNQDEKTLKGALKDYEILFYNEGQSNIAVLKKDNETMLRINGKTDASNSLVDEEAEILIGALPMLFHPDPKEVLVIGLGSGITTGTIAQFDSAKNIDLTEIDPAIVEAAKYFKDDNHDALNDPRVKTMVTDGRNYLHLTDKKYDVISSEPSNLWVSGNAYLFTKEFYELAKSRLKKDGVILQWIHAYSLSVEDIQAVFKTFQEVFPQVYLFDSVGAGDLFLVGSAGDTPLLDFTVLQKKFQDEKIANELARIFIYDPYDLLMYLAAGNDEIRKYSNSAEMHTDDKPFLEFSAPKTLYRDTTARILGDISVMRGDLNPLEVISGADPEKLSRSFQFARDLMPVKVAFARNDIFEALVRYKTALNADYSNLLMESYIWTICAEFSQLTRITKGEDAASEILQKCSEAFEVAPAN